MGEYSNFVYMAVTDDRYELPIAITNTVVEMAKLFGVKESTVSSAIHYGQKRNRDKKTPKRKQKYKFIKVQIF